MIEHKSNPKKSMSNLQSGVHSKVDAGYQNVSVIGTNTTKKGANTYLRKDQHRK